MPENNYPKLHNAAWPGIVGKGSGDGEPIIPLDKLLELTANARTEDGQKFDGIDLFITAPHFDIDSDKDAVKRMADHIAGYGLEVGSFVAPIWGGAGGGSAMGSEEDRQKRSVPSLNVSHQSHFVQSAFSFRAPAHLAPPSLS